MLFVSSVLFRMEKLYELVPFETYFSICFHFFLISLKTFGASVIEDNRYKLNDFIVVFRFRMISNSLLSV